MSLELRVDLKKLYPKLCEGCQKIMLDMVDYSPPKELIHRILMCEVTPGAPAPKPKKKKRRKK